MTNWLYESGNIYSDTHAITLQNLCKDVIHLDFFYSKARLQHIKSSVWAASLSSNWDMLQNKRQLFWCKKFPEPKWHNAPFIEMLALAEHRILSLSLVQTAITIVTGLGTCIILRKNVGPFYGSQIVTATSRTSPLFLDIMEHFRRDCTDILPWTRHSNSNDGVNPLHFLSVVPRWKTRALLALCLFCLVEEDVFFF
jgi:hypothetical protein